MRFLMLAPLTLTACVGTFVSGEDAKPIPDLRQVPTREVAMAPRGWHGGDENSERTEDMTTLQVTQERMQSKDQAIRSRIENLKVEPHSPD